MRDEVFMTHPDSAIVTASASSTVAYSGQLPNDSHFQTILGKSSTSLLAGVKAGRVHLYRVAGNTM